MKAKKPIVTRINEQLRGLRNCGCEVRFVRGRGYYYVAGVAVSSSLYWCWMPQGNYKESDYAYVVEHVNDVLKREGIDFKVR